MSIGNLKDSGNQGNNFPWQLKVLLGLDCSCTQLQTANSILQDIDDNTDQLEFLLSSILVTLQSSTEYEAKFVVDTCNGDTVYLEVRVWNPDDSTWGPITYYLPGSSTPVVPPGASTPGCLQYTDPSGVLGMILAELQLQTPILTDIETNTGDAVTELQSLLALYTAGPSACANSLSVTLCTEQGNTLSGILTELQGTLDVNVTSIVEVEVKNDVGNPLPISGTVTITDGSGPITVDGTVAATQSGTWNIAAVTGPVALPTGAATEATLGVLNSQFIAVTRTPSLIRTGGSGTIAAGARSISVYNAGSVAGSILGVAGNILPGEIFNFDAGGENDTLAAFAYNGAGTTLVITTIV
jgi:hypothetical protein